jgi:hypothetical protein
MKKWPQDDAQDLWNHLRTFQIVETSGCSTNPGFYKFQNTCLVSTVQPGYP